MLIDTKATPFKQPIPAANLPSRLPNEPCENTSTDTYHPGGQEPLGFVATPLTTGVACLSTIAIPLATAVAADKLLGSVAGPLGMFVGVGLAALAIPTALTPLVNADSKYFHETGKSGTFFRPYYHEGETVVRFG